MNELTSRELLARFELTDAAARPAKTYSGGMRRRLDLAASLARSAACSRAARSGRAEVLQHPRHILVTANKAGRRVVDPNG